MLTTAYCRKTRNTCCSLTGLSYQPCRKLMIKKETKNQHLDLKDQTTINRMLGIRIRSDMSRIAALWNTSPSLSALAPPRTPAWR